MWIKRNQFVMILGSLLLVTAIISGCQSEPEIKPVNTEPPTNPLEATKEVEQPVIEPTESPEPIQSEDEFILTSDVFLEGEPIPSKYACNGDDISPPLAWSGAPDNTNSFVLIMDDPDAPVGMWVHWVLFNIPGNATVIDVGLPADAELPDGSQQGTNSWGRVGYGGPCPPSGVHRYFFKLHALDAPLALDESATKEEVLAAMEGHILIETELMGTYSASGG
ncbi:MAG: YbhB/YbcL family Raf kinase inhibitor-like protein [Anaerolineales bacterium]